MTMRLRILIPTTLIALSGFFTLTSFQKKPPFDLKASITRGRESYVTYCLSCHMDQGEGIEGIYPPLAKADYLMADKDRAVRQIIYGASGEMVVNGKTYNTEMTGFDLTDQEVSDLVNYIRNSFGNKGGAITPEQVNAIRKK
jgi:mono/diheme cytochrome c family protein